MLNDLPFNELESTDLDVTKLVDSTLNIKEHGDAQTIVSRQNKIMSANLLKGAGTAIMNNTQRVNTYIVLGMEDTLQSIYFGMEHPRRLEKAAQNAGITDEIATIAYIVMDKVQLAMLGMMAYY